jgi:DNA-binding MarR family transcriptional regulator
MGLVVMEQPPPGYRFKQIKLGARTDKYQKERKEFTKFYDKVWKELGRKKVLKPLEAQFLMRLFPYCEYNTNFLVNDDNTPMGIDDIASALGCEERQTKRVMKSIVDKNLVAKVESGTTFKYAINPELYWKGGDMVNYKGFVTMFYTRYAEIKNKLKSAKEQLKTLYVNNKATSILH